jgi:hypothetical protein
LISASKLLDQAGLYNQEPIAAALAFKSQSTKIDKKVLCWTLEAQLSMSLLSSNKRRLLWLPDDFKLGGSLDDILVRNSRGRVYA